MIELNHEAQLNARSETMLQAAPAAVLVITTAATQQEAEKLARALIEGAHAACVQLVTPMTAIYRWQGKVETASEVLLLIKTTGSAYADLEVAIKQLHGYQTPEIIALPIWAGEADYLAWLQAAVKMNQSLPPLLQNS